MNKGVDDLDSRSLCRMIRLGNGVHLRFSMTHTRSSNQDPNDCRECGYESYSGMSL